MLINDESLEKLVQCYLSICTPLEQDLFKRLQSRFNDPRFALFVIPQRRIKHLLANASHDAQRPDFSVELPSCYNKDYLRLVFEADDSTHLEKNQKQIDHNRDTKLKNGGWKVERFCTWELDQWDRRLDQIAESINRVITPELQDAAHQLRSLPFEQKLAIQNLVALPVLEAQLSVTLAYFIRNYSTAQLAVSDPLKIGLAPVVEAVNETLQSLTKLAKLESVGEMHLTDAQTHTSQLSVFPTPTEAQWRGYALQQGVLGPCIVRHNHIASLWPAKPQPLEIDTSDDQQHRAVNHLLADFFRKVQFREGQLSIIARAIGLRPVIGLLPTGAGKSLCYQLASLLQPGFSLIVDPLRSLMQDQQNNLREIGIHRCQAIMSGGGQDVKTLQQSIGNGQCWFVFLAPERLQRKDFCRILNQIVYSLPVTFCVIDEAHCVSEWGHDFRPSYLNVGQRIKNYCIHDGIQSSIIALTGTASKNVLTDILKELQIDDQTAIIEPKSFDRKELQFQVIQVNNNNRISNLTSLLNAQFYKQNAGLLDSKISGLIFTYFRSSISVSVQNITNELQQKLPNQVVDGYDGDEAQKSEIQKRFKLDQVPVLVCTHGFGMGIDKPNVRFVIHAMLPRSLEDYYQQAGRAGRDQKSAKCTILFVDEDENTTNQLLNVSPEEINDLIKGIRDYSRSDLVRNLWFITNSFIGRTIEKQVFAHVVNQIYSDNKKISFREITPKFPDKFFPDKYLPKNSEKNSEKNQILKN